MGKSSKSRKNKVPKITEAEYANYVNALKTAGQVCDETQKQQPAHAEKQENG